MANGSCWLARGALVSLALASSAIACSSSTAASSGPDLTDLSLALAGTPDSVTVQASVTLAPLLDAADWYYLTNATWPSDATTFLSDPRVQKALAGFIPASDLTAVPSPSVGSGADDAGAGNADAGGVADVHFPLVRRGPESRPKLQDTPSNEAATQSALEQANKMLAAANGAALAGRLDVAATLIKTLAATITTTLPPASAPADPTTDTQTKEFYADGRPPATTNTGTPPCCNGTLTFPGANKPSVFECSDSTSCLGRGEPAAGGVAVQDFTGPAPPSCGCGESNVIAVPDTSTPGAVWCAYTPSTLNEGCNGATPPACTTGTPFLFSRLVPVAASQDPTGDLNCNELFSPSSMHPTTVPPGCTVDDTAYESAGCNPAFTVACCTGTP